MVILNYALVTDYQFPIITKYNVQFLKLHLKYHTQISQYLRKREKMYQIQTSNRMPQLQKSHSNQKVCIKTIFQKP